MPVWGLSQPFKASAKRIVPTGNAMVPPTQATVAKIYFAAKIPLVQLEQF